MTARSVDPALSVPEEIPYKLGRCTTDGKIHKFEYEWTINKFSFMKNKHQLTSSEFPIGVNNDIKCVLNLYPNGINEKHRGFLSLSVRLEGTNLKLYQFIGTCSILNAEKNKFKISAVEKDFMVLNSYHSQYYKRNYLLDSANGLLPEDKLTIFCEISGLSDISNVFGEPNSVQFKEPDCTLEKHFGSFLVNEKFFDITFAIKDRELRAHKLILAAHSDVFAAMFEHKMEENLSNRVTISDIDFEVFKEMLHFIYSGKAPNLNEMAHDLFAAADKYNLKTLKLMCESAMSAKLSVETAVETLILADRHLADQLKARSMDFIKTRINDVLKTDAWQKLYTTHPNLVSDVIRVAAQNPSH